MGYISLEFFPFFGACSWELFFLLGFGYSKRVRVLVGGLLGERMGHWCVKGFGGRVFGRPIGVFCVNCLTLFGLANYVCLFV